ncbi:alpha-N-acetylglucosaminidase C-terminal domain-containing protein [Candidatus Poribacteria bacterium]|nr:alpha-N-acetylglucosaminidase C-terminal domain-containing protein [Candidatus Poribacteria bacterium]
MKIVEEGEPKAVIILGERPTWLERHAAEELVRYIQAISGASLPIVSCDKWRGIGREQTAILIGRPETHTLVAQFAEEGRVKLSADYPGLDGFIIKILPQTLVLGGSTDPGTLYAVYYLLENFCHVGFFQDGEHIPQRSTITLGEIDVAERPYFEIRQYLQTCAFGYTTSYWEWEDWKRELDWMAKRYLNTMMVDWGHPEWRRIADYARKLGIKTILPGAGLGEVSEEFMREHPNVRYVKMQWIEAKPYFVIHPSDPIFMERGVETIRRNIRTYGTDHIYNVDPYSEQTVFLQPEEVRRMRIDFARATAAYIKEADPQGIWYASGWALLAPPWPEETAKAFLEAIPEDMFYICDIWADENSIYRKYHYFYGRDWGFGVLHSFGGDDTMRGDLAGLIRKVQQVVNDPKADRCKAFYINPEIIHYNILYFDLAARLSWDPRKVNLEDFLSRYALRRYGEESAADMLRCLKLLAESVYSTSSRDTEPYYQHRIYPPLAPNRNKYAHLRELEEALKIALGERMRQRDNRLFANDLVDMMRQYIAELSNYHLEELYQAFVDGEKERFEQEASVLKILMDGLEEVLFSREEYRILPIIEKAKRLHRDRDPADVERSIKDGMFTFVSTPWLRDYQSKDMFELVRFYYRRRLEAFVAALREALKKRSKGVPTTPNLLSNPGFEEGEGDNPARWSTEFVHKGGTASRIEGISTSGRFSGRLHVSEEGGYANLYQDVEAKPGEAYYLSARVRVKGKCHVSLYVDFMRAAAEWPRAVFAQTGVATAPTDGEDWVTVQGWFITPKKTAKMRIYCRQEGMGTSWFDDLRLQKVPVEEAPIVPREELDALYEQIEREWLDEPLEHIGKEEVDPVETVADVFSRISPYAPRLFNRAGADNIR